MTNSPKILHLSTPKSWRGGEQQCAYLMEECQLQQIEQVLFTNANSELGKWAKERNIVTVETSISSIQLLKVAKHLVKQCQSHGIQIIHCHDSKGLTIASLATRFGYKGQIIASRRVDFHIGKGALTRWKYTNKHVAKIICVSEAIAGILRSDLPLAKNITVVHSGIDYNKFNFQATGFKTELGLSENDFLIANTSALAPHKDYFTWLDTVKEVLALHPQIKFAIIGTGPQEKEIKDHCEKLGLSQQVIFTGFRKDIIDILPQIDLFFISSETEGLGTSIIDAFAAKVTVAATAAGGIPELVKNGETGLIAPVKDVTALTANIIQLYTEAKLRHQLSEQAYVYGQQFDKSVTAEKTIAIYREVHDN